MNRASMPLWFRAAVGFLFVALLVPYALLRGGSLGSALAKTMGVGLTGSPKPIFVPDAVISSGSGEPANGAYTLNGMLVRYRTLPVPAGPEEVFSRFEAAFRKAGYRTERVLIEGRSTLVGVHPATKMMLTVRPGRDRTGRPTVRLAEQDLSRLDPNFRAELPGIPAFPGAVRAMLVRWVKGRRSTTLTFSIEASAESAARFYLQEMRGRGWEHLVAPGQAAFSGPSVLFFRRGERECSVVVMPERETGGALVLVTVNRAGEGAT